MTSYSSEELKKRRQIKQNSDWKKVAAMTDDEIDFSDVPELDENAFNSAEVIRKPVKVNKTVNLDDD
ncbi:hypothetical protein [Crocosphaera sp. XPORK-15E]|uniref:hypothetical protein n=1 Tax=Crocosphaera sp. XPORK-15E TaxID=3110247 RepID=UPI002B20C411|nr:hypothetical protein [Crocosphaera sp. XPORK-15E]MEA5533153.1 hypothetical protein [Crocosphaera sp. XPORK-15E]